MKESDSKFIMNLHLFTESCNRVTTQRMAQPILSMP